ncbi:hypothetical protein Hanom_Chr11g00998711 [Helianthus anomalus]
MWLVPGSSRSGAGPNTTPPPLGFVLLVLCQTFVMVHKRTKTIPIPLSHLYIQSISISLIKQTIGGHMSPYG